MELIVQKFVGSTLADFTKIKSIAIRINSLKESGKNIIIIVSAMGQAYTNENGTTVEDMEMIEDSEVIALNSHKNVLRIHSPLETLSEAINWLRQFLATKNIPFPQLLHSEKSSDGIDLFMTAPIENIGSIAGEMRHQSFQQEGLCSVTTTCHGSTRPELLEKIVSVLEQKEINIMYMIISAMSVTIFMSLRL